MLIIVQRDATQSSPFIILQVHSTSLQSSQANLATLEGDNCTVPEAVVTVFCTPDDGCGWHPKHVEEILQNNKYTDLCCISLDNY